MLLNQLKDHCSVLSTIFLVMQMMTAAFVQGSEVSFFLRHHRDQESNVITLYCRNSSDLNETGAMFFLNNTLLSPENYAGFFDYSSERGVTVFFIKRWLEGWYSCGIGELRSIPVPFIAYPTSDLRNVNPMIERTKYAITGGTAVLDCVITPGALLHHYYVIWRNGSRNLFEQPLPSVRNSTIPNSVDPRYRLDPMNLSLIINNVQMSDSFNSYYCDLHVQDPRGMTTYKYDIALNISLIVLSPPVIITNPQVNTISRSGNAVFTCKARAYPPPVIIWKHNGMTVTEDQPDYIIASDANPGSMTTSSQLRVLFADVEKIGHVTCIASTTAPRQSGIKLASDNKTASLTVLGEFIQFDVLISMRGDVIFFFDLPTVYNQPVHLFIKYINGYNSSQSYNRTTTIGFVNTQSIQHVEYSSQVYYSRFQISAGIVSKGVHGPLLMSPGVYDKDTATVCDRTIEKHLAILSSTVPGGCLLLVNVGLVLIIVYLVYINRGKISVEDTKKLLKTIANNFTVNPGSSTIAEQPPAETVAAGAREEHDGPVSAQQNQSAQRQPSSTESDGPVVAETVFIPRQSTVNGRCRSYKHHPGYELLKMSVDEVFVGKKFCGDLKAKLKESCK